MWQRFTEDARRVVLLAQEEALRAQSIYVDTEHLLIGLFVLDEEKMGRLLEKAGAQTSIIRADTMAAVNVNSRGENPTLTPSAKRVLELASAEARHMQYGAIASEHLFLALLSEPKGRAGQILRARGADLERARNAVIEEIVAREPDWTNQTVRGIGDEQQLLSLLERRPDLLVEILGLDVLALKKARLALLIRLDMYEEAAVLRDEIENEHS